jgi:hypothetical protein
MHPDDCHHGASENLCYDVYMCVYVSIWSMSLTNTHTHKHTHTHTLSLSLQAVAVASPPQQATGVASRVLPELRAMILSWGLPAAQADIVLTVLADHFLVSTGLLRKLEPHEVMALTGMEHLVIGAKLLVKDKLTELKVGALGVMVCVLYAYVHIGVHTYR